MAKTIPIRSRPRFRPSASTGHTLVELLVASVLFGMAVSGVMSMLGMGRELEAENGLRRQARTIAANALESPAFHYAAYPVPSRTDSSAVTLITGTAVPVPATLIVEVTDPLADMVWPDGNGLGGTLTVPNQKITALVRWTSAGGTDTVFLRKRLAAVR